MNMPSRARVLNVQVNIENRLKVLGLKGARLYICWTVRWASVLAKNQINIVPDRKSENKLLMFFFKTKCDPDLCLMQHIPRRK